MRTLLLALACAANARMAIAGLSETQLASKALTEWAQLCEPGGKVLWKKSLCGPMLLTDPGTRESVANRPDSEGKFHRQGDVFLGTFPEQFTPSNTSIDWGGQQWATILLPLPADPFQRRRS